MKALVLLSVIAFGCSSKPTTPVQQHQASCQQQERTDLTVQRDVFFRCLETIPVGATHTSVGNSEWEKVISECHKVSHELAVSSEAKVAAVTNAPSDKTDE